MNPPDLKIEFAVTPHGNVGEVRHFLEFLRKAARKHSVRMSVSEPRKGVLRLVVPGRECWNFDLFLQAVNLNQGLHYYLCAVPDRVRIASKVVKPIFEDLLLWRFTVAYRVQIRKHLLDGASGWPGGDLGRDGAAEEYEILFQRFKLKMLSGYEFIRDLDDFLTKFMLDQLNHPKGQPSPKFNALVEACGRADVLRTKDVRKLFNRVHVLRTRGLHRLEREIPEAELQEIAQSVYYVFEWIDDYWKAQDERTVLLAGKRYRRVRNGKELACWKRTNRFPELVTPEFEKQWMENNQTRGCHDCGVLVGKLHLDGCDAEVCPRCSGQFMGCQCFFAKQSP